MMGASEVGLHPVTNDNSPGEAAERFQDGRSA